MLIQPVGGVGTSEAVPSWTTIWASKVSPDLMLAGKKTVTLVTALLESVSGPAPTKLIFETGVAVAVGVGVAGIALDR
jgi:hypothetical protein